MKWFLLLVVFLLGCSNSTEPGGERRNSDEDHVVPSEMDTLEDMVRVHASGYSTTLGTNDRHAKTNERPAMRVEFTYDFSIAQHETTCDEYNKLMKNQIKCKDKTLPLTNVTFYDAVLMANERSKKENFDTAYTYEKAVFDYGGHCTGLEGFAFHPEVNAYRLPTEAEWVLVANQGWNTVLGWTSRISEYIIHHGCTYQPNKINVCDMVGNVMELVDDWLGYFKDTVVTNFVGAPDGGGVGERIVKGGSYRDSEHEIKVSSRGDVYMVVSATKQEYIGFRLAFGAIENPTWMDLSGKSNTSRVAPIIGTATLRSSVGANKLKLVLRNDASGNLVRINYASALPTVNEIAGTDGAFHPDISPDGKWLAFCTGIEGVSGHSDVYVKSLDSVSAPAVRLDVESAAIPRWRIVPGGDTVIVYVTDAGNNKEDVAFAQKSTWQVSFTGGKFGKPKKLFDGAYHDGVAEDFAVTGSSLLRARVGSENKVWYGGEQACNASLAKDGSKRVLFLDFGGKTGHAFVGENYRTHERILIADSTGKLIHSIAAPSGYTFDHSEWAGDGIVATLANANGAHVKAVYINLADSSMLTLAEGDELWHPCLWMDRADTSKTSTLLDLDSAGVYYRESSEDYVFVFREKMEDFWLLKDSLTVVAMGSSRTMYGLYDKEMPSRVVLNMGFPGGDMYDANYIFRNYILEHAKNLKYLVLEVAPDMFYMNESVHWIPLYKAVPGIAYDAHHGFWRDGVPEGFIEAVKNCPSFANKETLPYDADFMYPPRSWGAPSLLADTTYSLIMEDDVDRSFEKYSALVETAVEAGVKVVGVIYPRHPAYKKTGAFGAYGPMRSYAKKIIDRVSKLDLIMLDENKWGDHDYTDEMAYDYDHLSVLGAKQLTHRVDSVLKTLE